MDDDEVSGLLATHTADKRELAQAAAAGNVKTLKGTGRSVDVPHGYNSRRCVS